MRIRLFLVVLFLGSLNFVGAATRTTMDSSAHDLSNESTDVSCLNCHWMHQRGSNEGYNHSLISEKTRYVCLVCHGHINPNSGTATAYLTTSDNYNGAPYLPADFFRYKPVQYRGANTVYFSGQPGSTDVNIYNIEKEYKEAAEAENGSYHMFFGPAYSEVAETTGENIFSCFDCHNHGVHNTGYPGDRLPKLLWSKGDYDGITKDDRKNIDSYYAGEYYCLSCHSNHRYPEKWDGLPWNSTELQIDGVSFQKTEHSLLDRYGVTDWGESRNPYGHDKDISCLVCHARHASAYPALMRGNYDENTMCQQCHYGVTPKLSSTFAFSYRRGNTDPPTILYNYITTGHFADKRWTTVYGHGKAAPEGAGLKCSDCHGAHGTGHYKMVKTEITNPRDEITYTLNASQISELDDSSVSGFCGGSCHNLKSPDNDIEWWIDIWPYLDEKSTTKVFPMASSYRGKAGFDLSAHKNAVNLTMVQGYELTACASCHDSHGTQNKALTWGSEEALCFQCHSASGGAKDIEKYFNVAKNGKSHHPIKSTEQTDSCRVECVNCHNPHLVTQEHPTIYPYDWSVISDSVSNLNIVGELGIRDHESRAKFCAGCHFMSFSQNVAPRYDPVLDSTYRGYQPPGVRISRLSSKILVGGNWFFAKYNSQLVALGGSGHYKSDSSSIDCVNCHNPHGSSNPSNIRDSVYVDPIDYNTDSFTTGVYTNFGKYDSFYNETSQVSRKFCLACHTPQYLTTQVVFPDSLGVSAIHHNSRNVPYGPKGNSYYVDEHDTCWDVPGAKPPSGILGCSVCHYDAHNPTPNYWYDFAGEEGWYAQQYCLDCHHPAESTSYNAATGKFLGGAPTKYESTYIEFCSAVYISKHLKKASINDTTSGYCKRCHGEHYKGWGCYYSDEYHDVPGSFVSSPRDQEGVYLTDYLNGQSFCLACHKFDVVEFGATATNIAITYETAGHGRLEIGGEGGLKVYCFDCHTKHASQNPHLLRTKTRDLITGASPDVVNRDIRVEDLTTDVNYVSVKVQGYQFVCFACHTGPGLDRDNSDNYQINAQASNPGTQLWLGKAVYESSGHGSTYITPYAYVDTVQFGDTVVGGMSCSQCHEPHGRGKDNVFNDDMLLMEGNVGLCYECHDTTLTAPGYTIANIKALFETAASTHNISCLNCHNPHTGNKAKPVVIADYRTDMDAGEDRFCLSCHCEETKVPTYAHGNPPPDVDFPERSVSEEFFTGYDKSYYTASAHGEAEVECKTCHKPHGTNKLDLLREVYDFDQDEEYGEFSYESILTDTVTYGTAFVDYKEEEVCFGCHRDGSAWAKAPDILRFYESTRSHHNVFASEQVATGTKVECESCHNQHIATKEKPLTNPDAPDQAMSAFGDECISFCLKCHDNEPPPGIIGLTDERYKNIKAEYGEPNADGIYPNFTGHYRQYDGKPHECKLCHSTHGSNFAKQIQDATDTSYDTFKGMRNMRPVKLDVSEPLGGSDTLFLSSVTEICLSCHSGKTQFYDNGSSAWRYIPLAPPPQELDASVNVATYHPWLLNTTSAYCSLGIAGPKKTVKSVYSTAFNIDNATINGIGCACHNAHSPYMASTDEFSNCYNCHDAIGGIETSFDPSKFIGGPAPLAHDDNTLLMLHLDGSYEGTSKELPVEGGKVGLRSVTGKYGLGVSFETAFATTKLVYPLWTTRATGAPGQPGIQHNETTDLTIRFNGTCNDEDAGGGTYNNSLYSSTGVTYVEGYIPAVNGAACLDVNDTLTYYSSASAYGVNPRANINISNGSFVAWVKVDELGDGYIFLHATNTVQPYKNAIFLRHSDIGTWDIGVSDETGLQSSIVSTEDELAAGWHHIAGTWSKTDKQLKLYIDGGLTASEGAQFFPSSTAETFRIGPIDTYIDEVQVSNYTKTDEEILEDYNCQNEMNFDPRRGTLVFWIKPYWDWDDGNSHYFFTSHYDNNNYFLLRKENNRLEFVIVGVPLIRSGDGEISGLSKNVWSHIAASWGRGSEMHLYLNGKEVDSSNIATMMGYVDTAIYFGSLKGGNLSVRAVMDEIWITDVMLDSSVIADIYGGNSNIIVGPITDPADGYLHYEGGSRHPINYDTAGFEASGREDVSKMECLKCHLQLESSHMEGVVKFVNVDSSMVWGQRAEGYNNSTKRAVTLFCLSCHMLDDAKFNAITDLDASGYAFSGSGAVYGGKPVQLRPLIDGKPDGSYYPIDTASAHFDTSFGAGAVGDLSCTDCHDPHGSINKSMLQDFEEAKEKKDYNRDGVKTREIQYFDRENVQLYQLDEEKFCYFCHNGKFNTTGVNRDWQMKDIEGKFAHSGAHHIVDDEEQAENDAIIECTSCHNPHTAKRDAVVLNPQTGQRAYVTDTDQMNSFCIGCHGDSAISPVILTTWSKGVKFPGLEINEVASEWLGNSWNEFNKKSMVSGNKHFGGDIACAACHDPHGTSNYRMLCETGNVYGLKLMLQTKPDGRERYEVYSTAGYSINKFCFRCHTGPLGPDPYYPRGYVYPGETAYMEWDFGIVDSSSKYDSLTKYDSITSGDYKYMAPDIYGKDKDCDYCHNPHSPDSVREYMVRDNVPQDLDRNSPNYGDKIDEDNWFQDGFSATGVDFCLSKGCHVTNRFAKLGPRDPNYTPGGDSNWWYKPYDQFNLSGKLAFSGMRDSSFTPDRVKYDSARSSKHPIVPYDEFEHQGNTLVCLSCHTPHGSPGNTELAKVYGSNYESTYPQDNAGLRRAYYRRIYWWPVTFWRRGDTTDAAYGHNYGQYGPHGRFAAFPLEDGRDVYGNLQDDKFLSPFASYQLTFAGQTGPEQDNGNPLRYAEKVMDSTIPSAGNDLCYMCHRQTDVVGKIGKGIDTTKTRFIGHEAVIDGAKIGETKFGTGSMYGNVGLNLKFAKVTNDFHQFTCSMCHGPHAATNEKLITNKCFAYNKQKPPAYQYVNDGRPSVYCHPYDNSDTTRPGYTNWNTTWNGYDVESGNKFYGWRNMLDTAKTDFDRPVNSIGTLFTYFNTTKVYDTSVAVPGLSNFKVTSSDLDVVLAWKSVPDITGATKWAHHYNVYRGETTLTQQNKAFKSRAIKTWEKWGYNLVDRVYDSNITRSDSQYNTLSTIDPSFAHTIGKRYFYMVVPADVVDNEAIVPNCQDTVGVSFAGAGTNTLAPRPITAISLAQETYKDGEEYKYRMRSTWQDAGDNLACNTYALRCALVPVSSFSTSSLQGYLNSGTILGNITDTSINTDIITTTNFGDYYGTTNNITYNTAQIYVLGIKPVDNQNNAASDFSVKYIRMTDAVPALITDLKAVPSVTANLSNAANNNYNVVLSWLAPYDNNPPIPRYKIYRRLDRSIGQLDIDDYNLKGPDSTDVKCCTTLVSSAGYGSNVYWTDNVEPNNVYYYAVTSVDKYATTTSSLADTAYGYRTDRVGWLYREQMMPCHNTKLLSPFGSRMKAAKENKHFRFSFIGTDYETSYFKEYRFYHRYETDKVWSFNSVTDTDIRLVHGVGADCNVCHSSVHEAATTECMGCHPDGGRGGLDINRSDTGYYYFAGSIVYNSVRVVIDEKTTWVDNLESPLNEVATMNVVDLTPPSPLTLSVNLVPAQKNGYDSVKLLWSGGTDAVNFKNYKVKYRPEMINLSSDWVVQDTLNNMIQSTWVGVCPTPETTWQTTNAKYGDFVYRYELWAWDSADNYSSESVRISTRPPSDGPYSPFGFTGESGSAIKLTWQNMYQYSYSTDYAGATGYNIYAGENKIGTVPAVIDAPYPPQDNQVSNASVSASSGLFPPSNANDGNLATFWKAANYDTFSTTYIEFDLKPPAVIASIVYNNSLAHLGSADTTQGYTILVSAATNPPVWETVVTQLAPTPRCETRYERSNKTGIQYIRVTGFSSYDYDLTELMAYCPTRTSTTFVHSYNNQHLRALPGHSYDYRIYLEDNTGAQSLSADSPSYLAMDTEKPSSVVDLIAFWSSVDSTIHLKWSRPYDNVGVDGYEIWRRYGNTEILDGESYELGNALLNSTWTTELFVDDDPILSEMSPYWYAVCAVDSAGNRSDFAGTNYSASAWKGKYRDTIPPEPITLESYSYSAAEEVTLNWEQGYDRRDYNTAGQADTTLYAVSKYNIYRQDAPFVNQLAAKPFRDWEVGTWGTPKIADTTDGSARKLVIYNYTGNPREAYAKNAAYIKTTGYTFETSANYIFGVWLKAEGQFSTTYTGNIYLDVITNTSSSIARRELIKPANDWAYYMLNFAAPTDLSPDDKNDAMIWANSNGTIWLDSARLVYLGIPKMTYAPKYLTAFDPAVEQNSTYYYAVTSVDMSDNGNEGDFANSLSVICTESGPVFDSVFTDCDETPGDPRDENKTGTTPTISLDGGNDNIFRETERIILRFKIKDALTGDADSTILDRPGGGRIVGTVNGAICNGQEAETTEVVGYYTFHYIIGEITENSTSNLDGTWTNLARIEIQVINKAGRGPAVDTTYQCILDNTPTQSME